MIERWFPSASISERVSFVARFGDEYFVYALSG